MPRQASIVLELQRLASDTGGDLTELLLKALVVARKLELGDFAAWINNELKRYAESDVPEYRRLRAQIKGKFRDGLVPIIIEDQGLSDRLSNVFIRDSVASLQEALLTERTNRHSVLEVPFEAYEMVFIAEKIQGTQYRCLPVRVISRSQICGILEAARQVVLEWSLRLEAEGILGVGMTFSDDEKQKASATTEIRIENFQGILGDVQGSSVTQNLNLTVRKGDLATLRNFLASHGVESSDLDSLDAAIKEDPAPSKVGQFGTRVSQWVERMVSKAAVGTWQIGAGTAGSLIANALAIYYGWGK